MSVSGFIDGGDGVELESQGGTPYACTEACLDAYPESSVNDDDGVRIRIEDEARVDDEVRLSDGVMFDDEARLADSVTYCRARFANGAGSIFAGWGRAFFMVRCLTTRRRLRKGDDNFLVTGVGMVLVWVAGRGPGGRWLNGQRDRRPRLNGSRGVS